MPTLYARTGFVLEIIRPGGSSFGGDVFIDGAFYFSFTAADTFLYLTETADFTFTFVNATGSDPTSFIIRDYDSYVILASLTFPLIDELKLVSGYDGESESNLSLEYPLQTFSFINPGALIAWACFPLDLNCSGLESTINELPPPKIIGNLTGCSDYEYKGDIAAPKSCNSESIGNYFLFEIRNKATEELLYSRVECCCPIVIAGGNEPPGFVCSCPDWGKATSYDQTLFSSSVRLREWVASGAGSKADCKHIMAAKRIMGIAQPTYTDPPYSAPPPPSTPG